MPSKLLIHVEPRNHFVGPTDFVEVCHLALESGKPYLVQAKGLAGLTEPNVWMDLKLEIRGFFDELIASTESQYISHPQQFVLTAGATTPAEGGAGAGSSVTFGEQGASATLLVKTGWGSHHQGDSVSVEDVVITALEVDEILMSQPHASFGSG